MENITFITKTFERPYCVKRLVRSIIRKYPDAKILIADDSVKSCKQYFKRRDLYKNVKVFELDNDCGLSAGRNFLVDKVETKYFVLLDDDFVFDDKSDIGRAIEILEEKGLDILGGYFRNYIYVRDIETFLKFLIQKANKHETPGNYMGSIHFNENTKVLIVDYVRDRFPRYEDTDIVHNFFVAKTNSVKKHNRWDNDLKLQEHTPFFYSAKKNGLKVGFSNEFSVQHKPIVLKSYSKYRSRNYVKLFMEKNDIKKFIATYDDGGVVVREYGKENAM